MCGTYTREKSIKANNCLYVIRTLKAEGYSHVELNYLFNSLIIAIINYGLSVEGDRGEGTRKNRGGRWAGSGRRRSGMRESYEGGRREKNERH